MDFGLDDQVSDLKDYARDGIQYIRQELVCSVCRYQWFSEGYGCCPLLGAYAAVAGIKNLSRLIALFAGVSDRDNQRSLATHFGVLADDIKWFHKGFDGLTKYTEARAEGVRALRFYDAGEKIRKEVWGV